MTAAPDAPLPELARHDQVLTWALPAGWRALSSAAVGGGLVEPRWVLNATVDGRFARTDLDAWAAETARAVGLDGPGCALLTAADVRQVEHAHRGGVSAWATVGVTRPTWPHDPRAVLWCHGGRRDDRRVTTAVHEHVPAPPGTVNIVVALPVPLSGSALVQALATATEAKAQVLVRAGVPGTGTASDAVVVLCPGPATASDASTGTQDGTMDPAAVPFAGVRSLWGRRVAHAVHDAVRAGLLTHPWTGTDADGSAGPVW